MQNMQEVLPCRMCTRVRAKFACHVAGYRFHECEKCGFVFCPDLLPETVGSIYEQGERDIAAGAPSQGWADPAFLEPALRWLNDGHSQLSALDFGAGQSRVPDILRQRGHRVTAVDLVPPACKQPDRLTGDLIELQLPEGEFDLAYSFQVFEHLPQPRELLFELIRLVRDNGLVLIHTDMETPERDAAGFENWWYVTPPDHCSFYRHKTFADVLADQPHDLHCIDEKTVIIHKHESGEAALH